MSNGKNHGVLWYSPQGFANEGRFIYGPQSELQTEFDNASLNSVVHIERTDLSPAEAERIAEKLADEARKDYKRQEQIFFIGAGPISDIHE